MDRGAWQATVHGVAKNTKFLINLYLSNGRKSKQTEEALSEIQVETSW